MKGASLVGVAGLCVLILAGCGLKTSTFKPDGRGYAEKREPYAGPICQLPTALPDDVEHEVVGLVRGNRGWFGGFPPVREAMANEARAAGADTIFNLRMRQDVAFRGIFILRPVGEGMGARLKSPESFDCLAEGGRIYPGSGLVPISRPAGAPATPGRYDDCMARVMRISDSELRLSSMATCDAAQ